MKQDMFNSKKVGYWVDIQQKVKLTLIFISYVTKWYIACLSFIYNK